MKIVILAAGEGRRLKSVLKGTPKPLLEIEGTPLIERAIKPFLQQGIDEIYVILRESESPIEKYLKTCSFYEKINFVYKKTDSALFSLLALESCIGDSWFFLTMVDSVVKPQLLQNFISKAIRLTSYDIIIAYTDFIQDEKPVYILLNDNNKVIQYGKYIHPTEYISAGIFYCSPRVFSEQNELLEVGISHLSDYISNLVARGYRLKGIYIGKVVDVDDEIDLEEAHKLLEDCSNV